MNHVKGYLTAIVSMVVLAACIFCTQFIPESFNLAINKWWISLIICVVAVIIYFLFNGISASTTKPLVCFLIQGFIIPILVYIAVIYAFFSEDLTGRGGHIFTWSSLISAGIAIGITLFFAIFYSALKENGGFARFFLMFSIIGLLYGIYALFYYALPDVLDDPILIYSYGYGLFFCYLGSYAAYETCDENHDRRLFSIIAANASFIRKL